MEGARWPKSRGWESFRRGPGDAGEAQQLVKAVSTPLMVLSSVPPPSPCLTEHTPQKAELQMGILHRKRVETRDALQLRLIPPSLLTFLSPFLT